MKVDRADAQINQDSSFMKTLTSSAGGGFIGGYICFPFEGMKKRLQRGEILRSDFLNLSNGKLLKALHPLELLRGSTSFGTSVTVASATSMTIHSVLRKLPFYDPSSEAWNVATAVGSGMIGAILGSTPVENTILVQQEQNIGPLKAVRHMLREGITRPWVGGRELMMREAGFAGVMLHAGPTVNKAVLDETGSERLALIGELAMGAVGALATHPADTLATYRQKLNGKVYLLDGVRKLYDQDGLRAFYRGGISRVFLFVGCAVIIPRTAKTIDTALTKVID